MNHQPPPLITVPLDLSDEAAEKLIDFLYEFAHRLESHYSEQLYRYHNAIDERQADLWSDTDPPFLIVVGAGDRHKLAPLCTIYPRSYAAANIGIAQPHARQYLTIFEHLEPPIGHRPLLLNECAGEGTGEKWWSETSAQQCRSGSI